MKKWTLLFIGLILSGTTFAAGFEKTVLWSGKHAGTAGAAVSNVSNSEALFFNPAGLAGVEKGDISLNFSPNSSTFEGPVFSSALVTGDDGEYESESGFSPVFGFTGAYRLTSKFVVGLGSFVSGGVNTAYNIDGNDQDVKGKLSLIDFTLGASYQVTKHFSFGAAWRATWAKAEFATVSGAAAGGPTVLYFEDLENWSFAGFRLGGQYVVPQKFGVGFYARTPVDLKLDGGSAEVETTLGTSGGKDDSASLESTHPLQVALGAHFHATPKWTLYTQFDWTNYGANDKLEVDAFIGANLPDITLNWNDQIVARLGTSYQFNQSWVGRVGYAFTSQVTNEDYAKATFSTPGIAHTVNLGVGASFGHFDIDAALDYSWADSEGKDVVAGTDGDFSVRAYGAHLGATYNF